MSQSAKRIVLVARPVGEPKASDFRLEDYTAPVPGPGQVLVETIANFDQSKVEVEVARPVGDAGHE